MSTFKVDFFVIGAARAGTTTLYSHLRQHPKIFLPRVKECNYFSKVDSQDAEAYELPEPGQQYHMKIIRGESVYEELFSEAETDQIKGEISPSYLWDTKTAKRIFDHNPEARIIISLRDPIHRAFSHYKMHYNTGHEKADSFEDALKAPKRQIWGGGNSYLEMGLYYPQLKPYFETFNRKQLLVLVYEEWVRSPQNTLHKIEAFLGVHPYEGYHLKEAQNKTKRIKHKSLMDFFRKGKIKRSIKRVLPEHAGQRIKEKFFFSEDTIERIAPETYERFIPYFKEDVERTAALTGIPLETYWNI